MARKVFGFLPGDGTDALRLIAIEGSRAREVGSARAGDEVILFVPGTDVLVRQAVLPTKGDRESRQAAPFAIEDEIATSATDLHVALGPRPDDVSQPRPVHGVEPALMEAWTARLGDRSLSQAMLVAEQSVLPEGRLIDLGNRVVGRLNGQAFAIDAALPGELLTAILDGFGGEVLQPADPLEAMARLVEEENAVLTDLRQGRYRVQRGLDLSALAGWQTAAVLAVTCFAAWLVAGVLEVQAASRTAADIRQATRTAYAAAFPGDTDAADPVRALSRALGEADTGPEIDFLDVSAALYTALQDVPGASIRSIRFEPGRGGYVASIAYLAYGEDAALKSALEARGFSAVLGDSRRGGDLVLGDVTITGRSL